MAATLEHTPPSGGPTEGGGTGRCLRLAVAAGSYVAQRDGVSVYTENLLARLLEVAGRRGLSMVMDVYACGASADVLASMMAPQLAQTGTGPDVRCSIRRIEGESARARYLDVPRWIRGSGPYDGVLLPNLQPVWLPRQRTVAVLHDLTYRVAAECFPRWRVAYMDTLTRWHLRFSQALGLISRASERDLARYYPVAQHRPRLYMPNGLPDKLAATPRITRVDAEQKLTADHLHLLFVGRMNRLKGFDRIRPLCRWLDELLARRGGKATLHLVGKDTPETAALMPATLPRVEVVRHGFLGDEQLNALYRRCAFCLFLSRNEGFGLPLLEAIWQRCVPVLSDIGIFREVMGPRYPLFGDGEDGLRGVTGFVDRLREDRDRRRRVLAETEDALQRWQWGYAEAAGNLLDWVSGAASHDDRQAGRATA